MNERIKELAEQADPHYTGIYDDYMGHALVGDEAIEKFAELIVRECIQVTLRNYELESTFSSVVKQHFGVEE